MFFVLESKPDCPLLFDTFKENHFVNKTSIFNKSVVFEKYMFTWVREITVKE